jgi:LPXTG-motif cell wall-anchored protein
LERAWSEEQGKNVRRLLAIVGVAMLGAFVLGGASIAGAQTTTTTIPFTCDFTVTPETLPAGGGTISVKGTAPGDTDVHITVTSSTDGTQTATAHSNATTGAWGPVDFHITSTATVSVTLAPFYPATFCIGPASVSVESAAASTALPRTGSNDTKPFVLIGVALLVVGTVLVIATRRRERTRGGV